MKNRFAMIADMHVHSTFSEDATSAMEEHCQEALKKGVAKICFTEHVDFNKNAYNLGITQDKTKFRYDYIGYFKEVERLSKIYPELEILTGIEFSEPHLFKDQFNRLSKLPYDNIMAAIHHCYNSVFPGAGNLKEEKAIFEYYDLMTKTIECCKFQTLAHLDFPKRYFDSWNYNNGIIKTILGLLVKKNIVLEVNTSTMNESSVEPMPKLSVIRQYVELGGKQIVLGSDAHIKDRLAHRFEKIIESLPDKLEIGYIKQRCFIPLIPDVLPQKKSNPEKWFARRP